MKIWDLMRKGLGLAAFAVAAAVISPLAHADAVINCCFTAGLNELEDTDADRVLRDGVAVTTGTLQKGDVIESLLQINTVNGQIIQQAVGDLNYGLWAFATLTLGDSTCNGTTCTFSATPEISVYETDTGTNYLAQAPATGISNVQSDGTLILTLAVDTTHDPADFWSITIPDDPNALTIIGMQKPGSGQAGVYLFGVTGATNPGNIPFDPLATEQQATGTFHDFVGDGSAFARQTGVNTGWLFSTNTSVSFTKVPEPGSLALLGLGLAVASWFGGRRRKA